MAYDKWRQLLEIAKLPTVTARRAEMVRLKLTSMRPDETNEGYYRKPVTRKAANGNGRNEIVGWIPVAYFVYQDKLVGNIGDYEHSREMTDREVADEELWSWVVTHPVEYEDYVAVVDRGEPWPDMLSTDNSEPPAIVHAKSDAKYANPIPAANREVTRSDNSPPEVLPEVEHATAIDNAIAVALKAVTNETEAAQALGSKNRIAELRLAADKAGKALYEPPYRIYKELHALWTPMVKRAKDAEDKLQLNINIFREKERRRIAKEQAEVNRLRAEQEEAAARAADRAIVAGVPEQPPEVVEIEAPKPLAPIEPTYGTRKSREKLGWHLDAITDQDAVYGYFKDTDQVKALLTVLATAAVRAGRTVPGTKTHEGIV